VPAARRSHVALSASSEPPPSVRSLASFPFPITELLLPGETKELHLYEARFLSLLKQALGDGGLAAQLVFADQGLLSLGSLLAIESCEQREVGCNVVVRAVGRLKVVDVHGTEPFVTALYAPVNDLAHTTALQRSYLRNQTGQVMALHEECRQARDKLMRRGPRALQELDEGESPSERVTWGHELLRPESGFGRSLDSQLREATAAIERTRAKDDGRADAGAGGGWDVLPRAAEADDLEFSLVSLLACACFPVKARFAAFSENDSAVRMDMSLDLLREQRAMLAAKNALADALGSSGSLDLETDSESESVSE
jgi:hypothetical protein